MAWQPLPLAINWADDANAIAESRAKINSWIAENPGWELDEYPDRVYLEQRGVARSTWVITVQQIEPIAVQ